MLLATLRFVLWEAGLLGIALWAVGKLRVSGPERWLLVLAAQLTLDASFAGLFSFLGANSAWLYWVICAACYLLKWGPEALHLRTSRAQRASFPRPLAPGPRPPLPLIAALSVPLALLSFRPTEEIDSINYLHYLIEWMSNRATPYTFATNYVAFWELSFLPAWMVTRVDWFFPLLALRGVMLIGLGLWLVGRELDLRPGLLGWTVFGALTMRHYWYEYSGVPTLKNDALHGAGFVLLALVVLRASRRPLTAVDWALLAFGGAFAMVKYTGIFLAILAFGAVVVFQRRSLRAMPVLLAIAFVMLTGGHYYLHNLLAYRSPFYPFQINLGPLRLPGTADLSNTSILYSLRDPRLWRALFLPAGGISPAGLLFPLVLAAVLPVAAWRAVMRRDILAACLLCGWALYFRSVYSASASPGDLGFLLNSLNSLRYVDGVLGVSELFLVALLPTALAGALVGVSLASRLAILYARISLALFPLAWIAAAAALVFAASWNRYTRIAAAAGLIFAAPWIVERNRTTWTTYWNDLKPALAEFRNQGLAELAMEDAGYFAGHVVAAGNPVNPAVRSLLLEEMAALAPTARPRYLAVLVTPGSIDWPTRYGAPLAALGYRPIRNGAYGALLVTDSH